VPILASLQPQERAKIADVLESRTFTEGQDVIKEGEAGEEFFLVESGSAVAVKSGPNGETVVKTYGKGDYFGELALLNRQNRAATVRATGSEKLRVAALGAEAFTRLLGDVKDIMARSVGERYGFGAR
jgi:cAMP-dependent protein kinase regulator